MSLARKKFTEFKERGGGVPDTELDDFWATLEPATIEACSANGRAVSSPPATR